MKKFIWICIASAIFFAVLGCNRAEETRKVQGVQETETAGAPPPTAVAPSAALATPPAAVRHLSGDVIAEVDGVKMTWGQLEGEVRKKLANLPAPLPPERAAQVTGMLRKQIVDDFVMQTLLTKEVERLKIVATDKEIATALDEMKAGMPAGVSMAEMLKKSGVTPEQLRKEIALGIKINKLVETQKGVKTPPTEKEIQEFYRRNQDKFKLPETVHARHILVAKKEGEDEKARAAHREKTEQLRRQLLSGKDFAALAKENSDCPSKAQGGDLGNFARGQMVKPFEDAAFAQKVDEIGPVVETDYGFHIIQVLDHKQARTQQLDRQTQDRIAGYLRERKKYEAFNRIVAQLKTRAHIVVGEMS
ncbi:MAG TPA: peptidylprolyl isomerase [Syntrophales bacterium]|nr:peptidylprolyl isomerase [Syntrophales bacterium]HQI35072.1 peptidylprolyl isomerase [Syntrophales bacterium]HRU87396.1 peptidylprolyl isomerase [Syntrophales bacterium]